MNTEHIQKLSRIAESLRSLTAEAQKEERSHLAPYKDYYVMQYNLAYPILNDDLNYQLEFQALKKPGTISYVEIKPALISFSTFVDSVIKQEILSNRKESDTFANEYFIEEEKPFSAYKQVTSIINQAMISLKIVDNFVDANTLDFFLAVNTQTNIAILTKKLLPNEPTFQAAKTKFLSQWNGKNFGVKVNSLFHDRFLIIDDSEVWHLGPSLNKLGVKPMMISMIRDSEVKQKIIEVYDNEWIKAQSI